MEETGRLRHIPALDGLRGLAVIGVIAFHTSQVTGRADLPGGFLGVDLFFVLSGFLITSLLLGEHGARGSISLRSFWARRARRLLPALLLVLVAVAVYAARWATPDELSQLRGDALATLGYVANWREVLSNTSYFSQYQSASPLQHTWSLAIEEQFYLVWPLVVGAIVVWRRKSPTTVLVVSLIGAAVSIGLMQLLYSPDGDSTRAYFGTDTRIAAILLGAALAAAIVRWGHVTSPAARFRLELAGLVGVVVLGVAWATLDGQSALLYRGGFVVCELAALAVIATAVHPNPGLVGRTLSFAPLCWIGIVSYGLYLWHWPVFVVLDSSRVHLDGFALLLFDLAVTLALTVLSFYLLERPIRRGAVPTPVARLATPAAAIAVAVTVVACTAAPQAGASFDVASALTIPPTAPASATTPGDPTSASGPTTTVAPRLAARTALGRAPKVLFVGDSVSFSLATGLMPYDSQLGVDIHSKAIIACGVMRGDPHIRYPNGDTLTELPACQQWPDQWSAEIDSFHPDAAVLVIGWPGQTGRQLDGEWRQPCDADFDQHYESDVHDALTLLHSKVPTVSITTAPYYRATPDKAPPGTDDKTDCLNAIYRRQAAATGVNLIDLADYICPAGQCRTTDDGTVIRDDGLHFNGAAGALVGAWVLDRVVTPLGAQSGPKSTAGGGP
jgi:peptidoglycan/LPS O-acetylase OafA/YrhL